jgi:hypothetical protein
MLVEGAGAGLGGAGKGGHAIAHGGGPAVGLHQCRHRRLDAISGVTGPHGIAIGGLVGTRGGAECPLASSNAPRR